MVSELWVDQKVLRLPSLFILDDNECIKRDRDGVFILDGKITSMPDGFIKIATRDSSLGDQIKT
jgi:hypothetical protein